MTSLLLLTPIGLDRSTWDRLELPRVPTIRHEYAGHGARGPAGPMGLGELADELAMAYPGVHDVIGVSMGGMVAQHFALRHPGRVRSLLLACTNAGGRSEAMIERASQVDVGGMSAVLEPTLERWFTPRALAEVPEHPGVAYARRTLLALNPRTFAHGWRAIAGHDVLERLKAIHAPTTCVAGLEDQASPPSLVGAIAAHVPGARLFTLGGPHMLPLERPAEFSATLAEHLRWVDGG